METFASGAISEKPPPPLDGDMAFSTLFLIHFHSFSVDKFPKKYILYSEEKKRISFLNSDVHTFVRMDIFLLLSSQSIN